MKWFRLKACVKCRGDLVWDEGDWLCLQCGRYYYTRLYPTGSNPDRQWIQDSGMRQEKAAAMGPVLLHGYRGVGAEPISSSPLASRTVFSVAETGTRALGLGSRPPAMQ